MRDDRVTRLLKAIGQAYDQPSWHGTNLKGALRGVEPAAAAWRPAAGRSNIWELAVHCAYWKYAVVRKLVGLPRGSFPLRGSGSFPRPEGEPTAAAWRHDRRLLDDWHQRLVAAVEQVDGTTLDSPIGKSRYSRADTVLGVAAHDLHHGGQIQLLKRLQDA